MVLVVAVLAAIYSASLRDLFHEWWNYPEHSQGLAVVPGALMVAWLRRASVSAIPATGQLRGLGLVGFACALHLIGQVAAGIYASQISFVVVLAGVVWTFWGIDRLRTLTLPILLLAAAIPLPSLVYASLSMPLQLLSSKVAVWVADLAGIAVYREGNIIHLANITVGVWEACSGLNSLSALMVGAVLLGFIVCRLPVTRVFVCIAVVPIAITANITRITGTALLSDWHPAYAMGFYHVFSGWFVFVVGAMGLYGAAISLRSVFEK